MRSVRASLAALVVAAAIVGSCGGQSYWYCWDTGDPQPHHLGHHVSGDHYCSQAELAGR
jgi:hypothetical protein